MTRRDAPDFEPHESEWGPRISAYIDADQSSEERVLVEEHIRSCATCAALLEDYRRVTRRLKSDAASAPSVDVLAGVLATIDQRVHVPLHHRRPRLVHWALFAAAAASITLFLYRSAPDAGPSAPQPVAQHRAGAQVPTSYANVVDQLQRDINNARDVLGPRAIAELEQSLDVIDRALADAEAARRADPENASLAEYVRGMQELRLATMRAAASNIDVRREALRS